MSYGSSISHWKPWRWMRLDWIFKMRDIDINSNLDQLKISGTISKSAKFKNILPWNISQMITRTHNQHESIVTSFVIKKRNNSFWVWTKVNRNWDNNMIIISQWREGDCKTNKQVWLDTQQHHNRKDKFGPSLSPNCFLEVSALLDVTHCPKLQSCAISRKSSDGNLKKWQKP